jgi:hypothetical protein
VPSAPIMASSGTTPVRPAARALQPAGGKATQGQAMAAW